MRPRHRALLAFALPLVVVGQTVPMRAIARIRGSTGIGSQIFGSVTFEQQTPLGDVTVRVSISGLRPGQHGFHVHQFGDVRSTSDLTTMSAHFVSYCSPPDVDANGQQTGGCEADQVHGLPPSINRQPGDMGNILVGNDGSVNQVLTMGQGKMSLADPLRSIVGRTVLVRAPPRPARPPRAPTRAPTRAATRACLVP